MEQIKISRYTIASITVRLIFRRKRQMYRVVYGNVYAYLIKEVQV